MVYTVEVKTTINASPSKVWQILIDFVHYPDWNPFIVKLEALATKDTRLIAHIKSGNRPVQTFQPVLLVVQENAELRWLGKLYFEFLFRAEHYFQIKPLDGDTNNATKCDFIHGELFSGLSQPLVAKMMGTDIENSFRAMNEALKNRAEAAE